ncbi:MAG: Ig-like domain-containing protein, partial [Clostridia bacterium]|nr:Ig-like domain-containing protein [Clostridia bacterium]
TEYTYRVSALGSNNAVTTYEITVTTDEDYGTKEFVLYKNNKTSERFELGSHSEGHTFEITDSTDKALTGNAKNITFTTYGAGSISFQKGNNEYNRTSTDKDGLFMYVKIPSDITTGLVISFPDVSESVQYPYGGNNKYVGSFKIETMAATDGYVPVFLPFSDPSHVNTGIKAVGFTALGTKGTIYVDDMKFIESTPVVEKVFYRDADGKIADGLIPTDISEIVVKFNTPMEEETLDAITVKTGEKTATYNGTYNPSDMTWNMKLVRTLESGALYTVNVPTSVRAIDKYGKKTGVWKENAVTFDISQKVTGEALAEPYSTSFNTEASKLQVTMNINKASGKVDIEIINNTGDMTKKAVTYFAAYENVGGVYKMLAAAKSDEVTLSENVTTYSVVPEIAQTFIDADFVKAMTWEGNNSMIPLCSAVTAE